MKIWSSKNFFVSHGGKKSNQSTKVWSSPLQDHWYLKHYLVKWLTWGQSMPSSGSSYSANVPGSHWSAVTFTNHSLCVWSLCLESCKMDLSETRGPVDATERTTEDRNKSYWNLVLVIQSRNCLNASSTHGEICKNSWAKWYFKVGNERKVRWVV